MERDGWYVDSVGVDRGVPAGSERVRRGEKRRRGSCGSLIQIKKGISDISRMGFVSRRKRNLTSLKAYRTIENTWQTILS